MRGACSINVVIGIGSLVASAGLALPAQAADGIAPGVAAIFPASAPVVDRDTVLVRLRPEALAAEADGAARVHGMAGAIEIIHEFKSVPGLALVRVAPGQREGAITAYRFNPAVQYAEANPLRFAMSQNVPYGIDMVRAAPVWPTSQGRGARVAVLDTGVMLNHEDLPAPMVTASFLPGETIDDGSSHGSHCAGTVLGLDNDLGVVGVAPQATLIAGKVLSNGGSGDTAGVMAGVEWAADQGADVVSMSLGGGDYSLAEKELYDAITARNVLIVAAAGNSNTDEPSYPAWYGSVVNVTAIDSSEQRAWFSNYGLRSDLAAPGVSVESTTPSYVATASFAGQPRAAARMRGTGMGSASGLVVNCGVGRPGDFPPSVVGNIAHVRRGPDPSNGAGITFQTKYQNALDAGAVGVIISNNSGGLGTFTAGNNIAPIPAVFVSQTDGDALVSNPDQPGTISVAISGSQYEFFNGTSMACPHVSGVAALLIGSVQPVAVPVETLRAALKASARDLGDAGWDPFFGYGLVDAEAGAVELRNRLCAADYNRDGFVNLEDLSDYITDYYTVPAIPGGYQTESPTFAGTVMGFSVPCPDADDAPAPYAPNAYRLRGYRVGYAGTGGDVCPALGPNLEMLSEYITLFYSQNCW
jgi:serine protease